MRAAETLIILAACVVNQSRPSLAAVSPEDVKELLDYAARHQLTTVAAAGLQLAGVQDPAVSQELYRAASANTLRDRETGLVLQRLEQSGIWYLPLKGCVLKHLYPKPYLRQMSDIDILFDSSRADDVHAIMTSMGYETDIFESGHRDDYKKPPVYHFELHRVLFDEELVSTPRSVYYRDIERLIRKDDGSRYGRHFSDEDFYLYMIAHEHKHYAWGGTGLRSLLDTYVYLKKRSDTMDWTYIAAELEKMELTEFEELNRTLALKLFAAGSVRGLNDEERSMLAYFITSGAYGDFRHDIENQAADLGKARFMFNRLFLPMRYIRKFYPFFYRHRLLIPFLPAYRLIKGWKNAMKELGILRNVRGKEKRL